MPLDVARKNAYNRKRYQDSRAQILQRMKENYAALSADEKRLRSYKNRCVSVYKIPLTLYTSLLAEQNNCCKVCGKHASKNKHGKLFIDHDHTTLKVRGLLCDPCNRAIGCVSDNPEILRSAARYLEEAR